jgi:HEPN domain-containing protein
VTEKADSFLELAKSDFEHARDNLRKHPRQAAWSLEQAAEKMIKAVLTAEVIDYPVRSHQLDQLVSLIPAENPFKADLLDLTRLTSAATIYRYPTPGGGIPRDPPPADMIEDLRRIELLLPEVMDWIRER